MSSVKKKIKHINRRQKALKKLMKRKRIYRKIQGSVARRNAAEKRFQLYGKVAIGLCCLFLIFLLTSIFSRGYTGFLQTKIQVPIHFDEELVASKSYTRMLKEGLSVHFPEVTSRKERRLLKAIISPIGGTSAIHNWIQDHPEDIGTKKQIWLTASTHVDMYAKGRISVETDQSMRKLKDKQIAWIQTLESHGMLKKALNIDFFTRGDSREPEIAGFFGALVGSLFVIISCMIVALPLGVMTAIYLEEFAPKNKFTDIIEVNINNLAAVPSIVFGLLGLMVYLQFFGIPRSASLAGGLTLALMALPVIVIATRTSIRAIPQSIRDGALAIGASKLQTTMHHVLPLAMPGIMTGAILSVARVLGETAPLLMIGMVAFVVDVPSGFLDPATAMPVQVYIWSDSSEPGFVEKTSAAIMILLLFLIIANAAAVWLRKKFEIRW